MIIAVDADGVLWSDNFPGIGEVDKDMISAVKKLIESGHEVILWTSRVGWPLDLAVGKCKELGLNFCAVNDGAPSNLKKYGHEFPEGTRKVYADCYIDDHAVGYNRESVLLHISHILGRTENDKR